MYLALIGESDVQENITPLNRRVTRTLGGRVRNCFLAIGSGFSENKDDIFSWLVYGDFYCLSCKEHITCLIFPQSDSNCCSQFCRIFRWKTSSFVYHLFSTLMLRKYSSSDGILYSQWKLQELLKRLRREQQEAQKLKAQNQGEMNTWKVGGGTSWRS